MGSNVSNEWHSQYPKALAKIHIRDEGLHISKKPQMLNFNFGIHLLDENFLICGEDSYEVQATSFIFMSIIEMTRLGNRPH